MVKHLAVYVMLLAVLALAGCSGHGAGAAAGLLSAEDLQAFKSSLQLAVLEDPTLGPSRAARYEVQCEPERGGCRVRIAVQGAAGLRSFYCSLEHGGSLHPASAKPGPAFGPESGLLSLARNETSRLYFGEVLIHPQDQPGFSGDGVLAEFHFVSAGAGLPVGRAASAAPDTNASSSRLTWDAATNKLQWYYANQGDYDQNGEVNLGDLTPLGIHFAEQGPFAHDNALSVVDGDSNGEINLADITPISIGFGNSCLGGYRIYTSQQLSDYPQTNTIASVIPGLGGAPWSNAVGNPTQSRLTFEFIVAAPQANALYWVRPVSSQDEEGTPSPAVGGNPADVPVISVNIPPPSGSGTQADPYIFDCNSPYDFSVISISLGDVTHDPFTTYYVSDSSAGGIDSSLAALYPTYPFFGRLEIWAVYDHVRTLNTIYAIVPPYYTWNLSVVDDGGGANNSVGRFCHAANISNAPAICYYDSTDMNLKYARWFPAIWPLPGFWLTMAVDVTGDVGQYCSIVNSGNIPVIAYYDATQHLLKCAVGTVPTPSSATDWTIHTVQDTIEVSGTSIALVNGLPAIAYSDLGHNHLHYARATNVAPSATTDWVVFELDDWGTNDNPSLHSVHGMPGLAFTVFPTHQLRYARATAAAPSSSADWVVMTVDAGSNVQGVSLNSIESLQPLIVYNDFTSSSLKYATGVIDPVASDAWNIVIADGDGQPSSFLSLAAVDGRFCIAYVELLDGLLHFARTDWPYPTEHNWQRTVVDPLDAASGDCSITAIGPFANEVPGIAYMDAGEDLRFAWGHR